MAGADTETWERSTGGREGDLPRFNVLGSLEGWAGGARLRLGGSIQERVLCMLLLESGRVVPVARLVEATWEKDPPATAAHQVRKAVADLRRRIPGGTAVIATDGPGYRAAVTDRQLDLLEFDALSRAAAQALREGDRPAAAERLRSALALWRGAVLSGTGGPVIEAAATALEERRLAAAEQFFDLSLALGGSGELVSDLRALITQHPLRETLRGQLMLALYRSGRQAEALKEYGEVRELLVDELGIDPGPGLARLYEAILRDGPELAAPQRPGSADAAPGAPDPVRAAPPPAGPEPEAGPPVGPAGPPRGHAAAGEPVSEQPQTQAEQQTQPPSPAEPQPPRPSEPLRPEPAPAGAAPDDAPCTLPYDLSDFTGRARELGRLLDYAREACRGGERYSRIVAIDGMGGMGKTTLAVHAAHRLAARYPDGQLHIDLRGFTPGGSPVAPTAALDGLLRTLGTPGDRIPEDLEGRTALWRAKLEGRRVLLLLDNAVSAPQIRPLLPASPGCLVLITSRGRLLDLDGVEWVSIGTMEPGDSTSLMAETLGAARVAAEPEASAELAELCGHLPLALRIATARLRNRPRWTVRYLVERLRDETRRMDELSSGERSVAATLRLSYLAMDEEYRTAFRILSLYPCAGTDVYSAAALLGTAVRDAEDALEFLLDVHLVQQPDIGLYTFHDLVRTFAQGLRGPATAEDDAAAVERLLGYYMTTSDAACEVLFPGREQRPTGIPPYRGERPAFRSADEAVGWFDREQAGLLAAVSLAERSGHDRYAACLSRNVGFHLHAQGQLDEFWSVGHLAVAAARRLDDPALLGISLANLGAACWKLGRFEEGLDVATQARETAVRAGDRHTEAHSDSTTGLLMSMLGRYAQALPLLERSVAMARELGNARAEAETLSTLSTLYERWGRYPEAAAAARRAVGIGRELGYRSNVIAALTDLAFAQVGLEEYTDADATLKRARDLCDETRSPGDVALVLALSARVAQEREDGLAARAFAERALVLGRTGGAPIRLAKVENVLGRLHAAWGEHGTARELHAHAHRIASPMSFRAEEAAALVGLAHAAEALGDPAAAAGHRAAAEGLFEAMGLPEHRRAY
ncbi:AfsR/SARP family transcriptional regulator [Streptomyces sp. TN58]|uniref:AfsR/SARP family transcriptional regulator n=1 Tax=Streptomyces sp. TN58 TaxID=234612 RepID=UPI0009509C37|nr:BTAD domain-containing putative transcriptional regulator [Streptomyces sp. TN58]APU41324.1 AfsR family transcriptional regulator [Streptomyces sp. TN58]